MIFSQILTNYANGVFEYLAKKAREGIYQPLTDALSELARVLTKLDSSNLNAILTNTKNGVLECLRKKPECLARILFSLESDSSNAEFMEEKIKP